MTRPLSPRPLFLTAVVLSILYSGLLTPDSASGFRFKGGGRTVDIHVPFDTWPSMAGAKRLPPPAAGFGERVFADYDNDGTMNISVYEMGADLRVFGEKPLRREDLKRKKIGMVYDVASVLRNESLGPHPLGVTCNERVTAFQAACDVSFHSIERGDPAFVNGYAEDILNQRVKRFDLGGKQISLNLVNNGTTNA